MNNKYEIQRGISSFYLTEKSQGKKMGRKIHQFTKQEIYTMFLSSIEDDMDEEETDLLTITQGEDPVFEIKRL